VWKSLTLALFFNPWARLTAVISRDFHCLVVCLDLPFTSLTSDALHIRHLQHCSPILDMICGVQLPVNSLTASALEPDATHSKLELEQILSSGYTQYKCPFKVHGRHRDTGWYIVHCEEYEGCVPPPPLMPPTL